MKHAQFRTIGAVEMVVASKRAGWQGVPTALLGTLPRAGLAVGRTLNSSSVTLASVLFITGLSVMYLLLGSRFVDLGEISIHGMRDTLNDQVGYISVARNFLQTGQLESSIIYPSFLGQVATKSYLYMPGHYFALAASYKLFGFGVWQSLLPSMVAYVVAGLAVLFAASRLYGRRIGIGAAVLFLLCPLNLVYALTAMAEMTLIAAATLAFALFVHLPTRWRVLVGPVLLILPLLFRETGVLVAVPMLALIGIRRDGLRLRASVLFVFATAVVALALLRSDISIGRPSLFLVNIFSANDMAVYGDAFSLQAIHPTLAQWIHVPFAKAWFNARQLGTLLASDARPWMLFSAASWPDSAESIFEATGLALVISGIPLGAVAGLWRRRDPFSIGTAALIGTLVIAVLFVYTVADFRGLRTLLLATPFVCITCAVLIDRGLRWLGDRLFLPLRARWLAFIAFAALLSTISLGLTKAAFADASDSAVRAQRDLAFVESLHPDNRSLPVAPWQFALAYVYSHAPARWSFLPANRATLELLNSRYPIGMIILPETAPAGLRQTEILEAGFHPAGEQSYAGERYSIFIPSRESK